MKVKIAQKCNEGDIPTLDEIDVYYKIKEAKKPKSGVPGDLPRKLIKEFAPELTTPLVSIYNNIISSGTWPSDWKVEFGIPLQKVQNPKSEDELRIISLTKFFSKVFEKFVMEWLLEYISPYIDCGQYGGLKGSSVSHYLVDFINFVLYNQDIKDIHAVLAVAVDFSKAFNRVNHNIVIELLSDLGVPGWLLDVVIGFLEHRELLVNYKGETSNKKNMPGGGPQGTLLGMLLFLVLINAAGFRENIKNIGKYVTKPFNTRKPMPRIHMKYVDDMTAAEAINLKKQLIANPNTNPVRPLQYHDRTEHILPEGQSQVKDLLDQLVNYSKEHKMKLNSQKNQSHSIQQCQEL